MKGTTDAVLRLRSAAEEETLCLGRALGGMLVPGVTVLLSGDLGTGKTVLVRGVGEVLGATRVRSPSFTLVNEYPTAAGFLLVHADLYRLEPDGVEELGLEEYADGCVLFVEWPDRWRTPPDDALKISIEAVSATERLFYVQSPRP
jgi:tRNA threonylcarbamoyladenosine biosynthesis protein TsaE